MSEKQENLALMIPERKPKRAPTLYFIIGFKFMKGLAALLLAVSAFNLTDNNLPEDFRKLLEFFHLDPEKRFFVDLTDRIGEITVKNLEAVAIGSIIYSLFMFLQAGGLIFRVSWIVWLVIAESAFFIPIEILELIKKHVPGPESRPHLWTHPKIVISLVLAANVAIVWYLFKNRDRIIRHHHHP